jgi:hypothetical protein
MLGRGRKGKCDVIGGDWWASRYARVGMVGVSEKNITTLFKLRFFDPFIVLPPYPLPKTYDGWVRREGYGGPNLGEKSFQLFSLFIV